MNTFVFDEDTARCLVNIDAKSADVVRPFLGYEDLVASPTQQTERWTIYFSDWPLVQAETYRACLDHVSKTVAQSRRGKWWCYRRPTPELYAAIRNMEHVLVIGETSEAVSPILVRNGQVFAKTLIVFAENTFGFFATVASSLHHAWILAHSSTLETRLRYVIGDIFETFPFPLQLQNLESIGQRYHECRATVMLERQLGLTKTYNLVHDRRCSDSDIAELRELRIEMDNAVARAYGWSLPLDHGFHPTKQGERFTISPESRQRTLDLLLNLNHERYAAEQREAPPARSRTRRRRKSRAATATQSLFTMSDENES